MDNMGLMWDIYIGWVVPTSLIVLTVGAIIGLIYWVLE